MPLLTDAAIRALDKAEPGQRRLIYDEGRGSVAGFAVMVTESGAKSYVMQARFPGVGPTRRSIGKVGSMTLARARTIAGEWRDLIDAGKDPQTVEAERRRDEARKRGELFADVADRYVKRYVRGPERKRGQMRSAADVEYIIARHLVPRWGKRPVSEITADHVAELCEEFERKGIVAHARNVFTTTRGLFKWAISKRYHGLTRNPCESIEPASLIGTVKARNRVLSGDELVAFWRGCDALGYPFRDLLRLVLLCGLRRDEAADAQWPEFDLEQGVWTIPEERFKSGRVHIVPLSRQALAIVEKLPRFLRGKHLFTTTAGEKPVSGFSKAKLRIDGAMSALIGGDAPLEPWTFHDLRRTTRTGLSALRVPPIVAECVIGHTLPGLLKTYDQWAYFEEKQEALQRWADHVETLVQRTAQPCPAQPNQAIAPPG